MIGQSLEDPMATRAATLTLTDPLDGILPIWTLSDAELKAAV